MWNIGNISGTNGSWLIAGGTPQQGTALQLFQTTNASQFHSVLFRPK